MDAAFYESKSERGFATILQRRISTLWYNLRLLWCCVLYNLVGCVECFFFFLFGPSTIQYVNVVGKVSGGDGEGPAGYRCAKEKERQSAQTFVKSQKKVHTNDMWVLFCIM